MFLAGPLVQPLLALGGDGTTPTSSSTLVTGPLQLQKSQTVNAIAIAGSLSSGVTSAVYTYAPGSQTIDTLVGSGNKVGDNIPAVAATLNAPFGVAVDTSGNVYIADTTDYRIRKIAAQTGIITTIAGTGTNGFSGDNGPATNAAIGVVHQIAVDGSGNLYLADSNNNRIRMVAAGTGTMTTVAGSGSSTFSGDNGQAKSAGLPTPYGVAVDGSGNLYLAMYSDSRVRKVTAATGVITTIAGNGNAGFTGNGGPGTSAEISKPYGVAVDASGNVFIADTSNFLVRKVSASTGIITTFAGTGTPGSGGDGGAATSATLGNLYGISVDVNGNVYLADSTYYRVRKVTAATGLISTVAGTGTSGYVATQDGGPATSAQLTSARAVATDVNGNLLIADGNRVREVTAAGIISTIGGNGATVYGSYIADGLPGLQTPLTAPIALARDAAGNLYFTDVSRVRKLAVGTGIVTTVAGTGVAGNTGDGGAATSATLSNPQGLAFDAAGNLYIADTNNSRIRKVTMSTGTITAFAGTGSVGSANGPALSATFNFPRGIAFDAAGNLYIADYNNYTVRVLKASTGVVSVFAGTSGTSNHTGDGGPATSATLGAVFSVAVDASGGVYIADGGYNMVRKVTGGTISTVAGVGGMGFSGDGSPATSAYFNELFGVAVDTSGNLYIADTGNQRVRKVTGGVVNTIVGNATAGYVASQDGGPAASAELKGPNGVLVDANGTLYIADTGNARIRVVYP